MKFFGKRHPSNRSLRGEALTAILAPADADWLVGAAINAFASHGRPVTDRGDGTLVAEGGETFGLGNLARHLRAAPRREWPTVVDQHAAAMTAPRPEAPTDPEEYRRVVLPRLMTAGSVAHAIPEYAAPFAGGLWRLAAVDLPDVTITTLASEWFNEMGGWHAFYEPALDNLRAMPHPSHDVKRMDGDPAIDLHVFEGDVFTASRLLIIDELMATAGEATTGTPLLAAVPYPELLLVNLVEGEGIATAIYHLVGLTQRFYHRMPHALSPCLYFRSADGGWAEIPVDETDDDGLTVSIEGPLEDYINSLS